MPWDPSVQAFLPFPSVLEMMAYDMSWTTNLGNAFLSQQQDVMDAVQRERRKARDYGYLRSNAQISLAVGLTSRSCPSIPATSWFPTTTRQWFSFRRAPGIFVGGGIRFGSA